jgi:hypothetical protein
MSTPARLRFVTEFVFWVITAIILYMVIEPIRTNIYRYPFLTANVWLVIIGITSLRYVLLLKVTPFARVQVTKIILMICCIPAVFYSYRQLSLFQTFADNLGVQSVVTHLPDARQGSLIGYIRSETIFFAVCSIVGSIALGFRLLISIWRQHNRNTV